MAPSSFLGAILLVCVGVCLAKEYHKVPAGALDKINYSHIRFPNHPFFPKGQRKVSPLREAANCTEYFFNEQFVDHFDYETPPLNKTYYSQRYFVCDAYWSKSDTSPVLFYTGNEADVELYVNHTGLMYTLAPEFGALLVFAEHRYFGLSQPFGAETPNYMNYLSMEQAMADYAHFIPYVKNLYNISSAPVVSFGGSYGGMLSSWFRMKYPGTIDGVIAGSAPIMGFLDLEPPYNINAFQQIETADATPAQGSSNECVTNVRDTFSLVFNLGNSSAGLKELTAGFNLCTPLQSLSDVENLANWLKSGWDFMTMGNYPYPTDYITNGNGVLPSFPVRVACDYLNGTSPTPQQLMAAMGQAVGVFYNVTGSLSCYDINGSVNNQTLLDGLYWSYLACTELFMPSAQDGKTDMFWNEPFVLQEQIESCVQTWGVTPRPEWVAETYGGIAGLRDASNIFFSNGVLDPWHGGGVLQSTSPSIVTSLMQDAAHHLDLMFPNPLDPPDVLATRISQKNTIQLWVQQNLEKRVKQ